ncbi:hypothetical protein SGQ83_12645 [Flavobacterium sp. Fl-318]|jgi:hypothetical protein|uniref:Uncharacterized protein n=1 Tax=Flavobacterium cupriresistens TaxID=2893885 RepID=A0ABU4RCA8_9FLAO|nr:MULTISPECIES: hypothetical protein [unclassified Flavobacterium]MDX6190202.1 hypothetical protein [Flavobacterium sp. Fl-318]UFH43020.1 hypothetical protein LNP23_02095 [Flavobacterium sp. F-323]
MKNPFTTITKHFLDEQLSVVKDVKYYKLLGMTYYTKTVFTPVEIQICDSGIEENEIYDFN